MFKGTAEGPGTVPETLPSGSSFSPVAGRPGRLPGGSALEGADDVKDRSVKLVVDAAVVLGPGHSDIVVDVAIAEPNTKVAVKPIIHPDVEIHELTASCGASPVLSHTVM